MRTTAFWAFKRRLAYGTFFASVLFLIGLYVYFQYFYHVPTCFDGVKNNEEVGVDCGGACVRMCSFELAPPTVRWARSFNVTGNLYNAVAYVENTNRLAASPELKYTFSLFDEDGLITERSGSTILPPNSVYPIFEGRIDTGGRVPTRTFLDLEPPELWQPSEIGSEQFTIVNRELENVDSNPKLNAVVENQGLEEVKEVELVATIFDSKRTALTSSRTFIDNFAPRSEQRIVFTWPEPIATTIRSCEIPTDVLMAVDLSGSMNDDGGEPPQPISDVKVAAADFVDRLGEDDQVSVVTFATDADLLLPLSTNRVTARNAIENLSIAPKEEVGSTNTGAALETGGIELNSGRHNNNARKVMVLLTDGLATAPDEEPELYALEKALAVKQSGVEIYVIGLGENVNMDFVRQVASSPNHSFQALTRSDVDKIYRSITSSLCEDGVAVIDIIAKTDIGFVPLR